MSPRPARRRPHLRAAVVCGVAAAALLGGAPGARADSAALTVTTNDGAWDPAAFLPRIFTVSGTASPGRFLFMKHRAAGGAGCAPSAYADPGSSWTGFFGLPVNGPFRFSNVVTWDATGTWMYCFWLAPDERAITSPIVETISFRAPTGALGASSTPAVPRPGQRTTIRINGVSEAPRYLYAKVRTAGGAPCAATYDADPGQSLIAGEGANGTFTGQRVISERLPGTYLVCAWLAGSGSDPAPVAAQPFTFSVVQPKPVISSAAALNCPSKRVVRRFHAAKVGSVCMRYRFSLVPYPGQRYSITYLTPARKTYKTVASTWPTFDTRQIVRGVLPKRAYKHRRGTWRAVLRIDGKAVKTATFRVL